MSVQVLQPTASPPKDNLDTASATDLEKVPVDRVLAQLTVKPSQGLSSAEAKQRLAKYGPNALVEIEESLLRKILGPFTGPIAYMIEAAAVVSAVIGHWTDFAVITGLFFSMPCSNSGRTARRQMRWLR
jgi:H+-transporting ATPase